MQFKDLILIVFCNSCYRPVEATLKRGGPVIVKCLCGKKYSFTMRDTTGKIVSKYGRMPRYIRGVVTGEGE